MGKETGIAWTDHTFNPWHGCRKISAGCANCYAATLDRRLGRDNWNGSHKFFGAKHWREPHAWNLLAQKFEVRRRVFCASMADVFEDGDGDSLLDAERRRLWDTIAETPWLDWQLLTKRPENIRAMYPWAETPRENVWLGVSVENQEQADARIPHLLEVPAMVRFLSCEPLLGPVDLRQFIPGTYSGNEVVDWVIAGGESGSGARPCDVAWIRSLRDQCRDAGTAFFCKQLGARAFSTEYLREKPDWALAINGAGHGNHLRDAKGADPAEWPEDLRVQEFPP